MHVHQSLKGIVIAQVSECPSLMVKPTFCGQTRKVGNVPQAEVADTAIVWMNCRLRQVEAILPWSFLIRLIRCLQ